MPLSGTSVRVESEECDELRAQVAKEVKLHRNWVHWCKVFEFLPLKVQRFFSDFAEANAAFLTLASC